MADRASGPSTNLEPEAERQARVFAALSTIAKPLTHVAGVAVALAGIATIIGWASLRSYLTGVGAPWAIWLVDPAHFVTQSLAPLTSLIFAASWLLCVYVDTPQFDVQKRFKFAVRCAIFGGAILAAHFSLERWIFTAYQSHWNLLAYAVLSVSAIAFLTTVVKVVVELINTPSSTMRIFLIFTAIFLLQVLMVPIWEAKGQRDTRNSAFNYVELGGDGCRWKLVRPISRERVLLIDSVEGGAFRVVSVVDLGAIRRHAPKECHSN